jgi:hypothetical protein
MFVSIATVSVFVLPILTSHLFNMPKRNIRKQEQEENG